MEKRLYIPWWTLVLAGWLFYGGQFALTFVLSFQTAPPGLTKLLFDLGRLAALALMAGGVYVLLRQWMGVVLSLVLGVIAGVVQMWALNVAIILLTFPKI